MIDYKTLIKISKEARLSMRKDSDGELIDRFSSRLSFVVLFYGLPILAGFVAFKSDVQLSKITDFIGTVISIFTGLFFLCYLELEIK